MTEEEIEKENNNMEFDISRVYSSVNADKLKLESKVIIGDTIEALRNRVKNCATPLTLSEIKSECYEKRFRVKEYTDSDYSLVYFVSEPENRRMTFRELAEWLAKGNGQYTSGCTAVTLFGYNKIDEKDNSECPGVYKIRKWGSDKWIEPTIDIYNADIKGELK